MKTGEPHAKEWEWTTISLHTQTWTQKGLKAWMSDMKPENSWRHRGRASWYQSQQWLSEGVQKNKQQKQK